MNTRSFSPNEFLELLNSNTLKTPLALTGIVKKGDSEGVLAFMRKGDLTKWISIPISMISSLDLIKTFSKADVTYAVARIFLNPPATSEGKALFDLLALSLAKAPNSEHPHYCERNKWISGPAAQFSCSCAAGCGHESVCDRDQSQGCSPAGCCDHACICGHSGIMRGGPMHGKHPLHCCVKRVMET